MGQVAEPAVYYRGFREISLTPTGGFIFKPIQKKLPAEGHFQESKIKSYAFHQAPSIKKTCPFISLPDRSYLVIF